MLALKYRPHRFSDLLGQDHVVVVLQSILRKYFVGQGLPAGFLFAGTRGTGKTTTARIVASVLNCIVRYSQESNLEPCCECENCRSVSNSNCIFVHEIDAASTGLVDDIRKVKELVSYSHGGNVRVIILDEAHSLSKQAFEALLKQLEEPMPNTLYILCTTEPDKFPDTILSRLMQFSFKQMIPDIIVARLTTIVIDENIKINDSRVLSAIAYKAQGAMRDAITMLEQLASYRSPLTMQDVLDYYGLVSTDIGTRLLDMARKADIVGAKQIINQNFTRSVDVAYFLDNFMSTVTDSMHSKLLTSSQVVDSYKAAVEVKSKLKYMSAYVAANYLFALLLRMFSHDSSRVAAPVTTQTLQEMFQ